MLLDRRDAVGKTHQLDRVVLTATPETCTVPLLWDRGTNTWLVRAESLHSRLDIASSELLWPKARKQLVARGARVSTAAEMQLLRNSADVGDSERDQRDLVIDLKAARRWLRTAGEPEAARQLRKFQRSQTRGQPDDVPGHARAPEQTGSRSRTGGPATRAEATGGVVDSTRQELECRYGLQMHPLVMFLRWFATLLCTSEIEPIPDIVSDSVDTSSCLFVCVLDGVMCCLQGQARRQLPLGQRYTDGGAKDLRSPNRLGAGIPLGCGSGVVHVRWPRYHPLRPATGHCHSAVGAARRPPAYRCREAAPLFMSSCAP